MSIQAHHWLFEPQFGIEVSYNQLRAVTDSDNQRVNSKVSEARYQPFAALSWQISDAWQLYGKLNMEFASLKAHAQNHHKQSERHVKPLLRLSYTAPDWDINWQFKQQVEQLDFGVFVASQDISFDRVQVGNNHIKPSRYSELSMQWNYSASDYFTLNSTIFTRWLRDIHESVLLNGRDEGTANAGRARLHGLDTVLDIDTDTLLANSRITLDHQYRQARYHDPLSGQRPINELTPHTLSVEFRHNYHDLSWGVEFTARERSTEYYVFETSVVRDSSSTLLFLEMPLPKQMQLRLEASAIEKEKTQYWQQFYQPNRAGEKDGYQIINEKSEPQLRLTVRGQL